ncbi:MAG TPA: hypothetical protein VNK26_02805 [Pyrinomonadaceae bacterium]|nr:hypothetical protein [Pyrinomonadaceae bacterium]
MFKGEAVHHNLNTAFIDLRALIEHLSRLDFSGAVTLEMPSYQAEVIFLSRKRILAREYDLEAGRISQGERVLDRVLKRCELEQGQISIYRASRTNVAAYVRRPFVDERILRHALVEQCESPVPEPVILSALKNHKKSDLNLTLADELFIALSGAFAPAEFDFDCALKSAAAINADNFPVLDRLIEAIESDGAAISLLEMNIGPEILPALIRVTGHIIERLKEEKRFTTLLNRLKCRLESHFIKRRADYESLSLAHLLANMLQA